ncbi:hypothetical protein BKA64DRAFT_715132 [Cadophora sp. MPI-SDFR-AT-0126]|nr:hypothetical protein BKA64DRAFT_715132 [Leotiomycetes sp. MPI-SDFR-AT-0126]
MAFVTEESTSDTIKVHVAIFTSSATPKVVLPDVEPSIFQLAVSWLHNGFFTWDSPEVISLDKLIDVYLLGDLIGCHALKNYTMDLIQDDMYSYAQRGSLGIRLSLNQIRTIFANTINAEDAPIRSFVAALVSYRLIFGLRPERFEPIFEVPGFLKDFAAFQRSSLEERSGSWYTPISLKEDPRARGFHDVGVTKKGFHICSFHVHREGEKCTPTANHGIATPEVHPVAAEQQYCLEYEQM